jgi:hypothetical protein
MKIADSHPSASSYFDMSLSLLMPKALKLSEYGIVDMGGDY